MNRKQLLLLLVLAAVLGGAALMHHRRHTTAWSDQNPALGRKLLGDFQVNDVAQIHIVQGASDLTLLKTNGVWCVEQRGGYPADFSQISRFLLKARDLKIVQTMAVGPSRLPRLNLAAPGAGTNSATRLEFDDAGGKPMRSLRLGKMHQSAANPSTGPEAEPGWPDGRYVLAGDDSTAVAVVADPLDEVAPQPDPWLDKSFFKVEGPGSVAVEFPNPTNSWKLTRKSPTNDWTLADIRSGERLDKSPASETADSFSSPSFVDVAVNVSPAQSGLDKPTRVEIKTFDGFNYSANVGRETNENYYFSVTVSGTFPKETKPDDLKKLQEKLARESALNRWTYIVPAWSLNSLLKTRGQLLVSATNAPAPNAPAVKQAP